MSDFTTVFRDDFSGSALDTSIWRTQYSGQYGNGMFRWDPAQLEVGGGVLTIATERDGGSWLSGGLSTIPDGLSYGSYEFRARFGEGQGTAGVALLWPSDGQWTDEVDIVETHDPSRDSFAFSRHGDPSETQYVPTNVDGWHTYRLDWTPDGLTLFVDGEQKGRIDSQVPSQPMSFGFQGQVMAPHESWFGGGPDGSTPDRVEIEVDWVQVSAWTPGAGNVAAPAPRPEPVGAAPAWQPEEVAEAPATPAWQPEPVAEMPATSAAYEAPGADAGAYEPDWSAFARPDGSIDWQAAAAAVLAHHEATGNWFF